MPICMKCGDVIGKGHICSKCQVEFSKELAKKNRKKTFVLSAAFIGLIYFIYAKLPSNSLSQIPGNAQKGSKELGPAISGIVDAIKEPATLFDIQARLLFAAIVFALVGSFFLLAKAGK